MTSTAGCRTVLLRDDDINFFTRPSDLEQAYRDLWTRGPVTMAVIPYVHGGPEPFVPDAYRGTCREHPLGDNRELVAFLRDGIAAKRISIVQHGCTHEDRGGWPEFAGAGDLADRLRRGRAHLERTLGVPVTTFVPPHNRLSLEGYDAVLRERLNLLNLPAVRGRSRPVRGWVLRTILARVWYRVRWRCEYLRPVNADAHWELGCEPLTPRSNPAGLRAAVALTEDRGWTLPLATHYWEAAAPLDGGTVAGALREVLAMIDQAGPARFVSPDEVFAAAAAMNAPRP